MYNNSFMGSKYKYSERMIKKEFIYMFKMI